ncbi:MAG: RNA-binding S4 domain-containing protein [Pseudomonadota bacterium]
MTPTPSLRIDKWLWHARFVRSRSRAATLIAEGGVRLNRQQVAKPSAPVAPGDLITVIIGNRVRAIEVLELGSRRGPSTEALCLYRDLSPRNDVLAKTSCGSDHQADPGPQDQHQATDRRSVPH